MAPTHNRAVSKFAHDFQNCRPQHENIKHIGSAIGAHSLRLLQLDLSWRRIQSCSHEALFDEARMGETVLSTIVGMRTWSYGMHMHELIINSYNTYNT